MIKIGSILQVNRCYEIAGVHGALGQVVDIQTPDIETYVSYPLWIRILTGEQKGKIHGFNYGEVKAADYSNLAVSLA
jgi:hypothetical protein